jgi:polar amino acid transport system substrate-binding protein
MIHQHMRKGTTMHKTLAGVGGVTLVLAMLTGCGSDSGAGAAADGSCTPVHDDLKTARSGVLTTATYNFPPFVKLDGTEVSGLEGDILKEVAEMECLDLQAQPLDTGSVIPATQNGRADIASGNWYCTAERAGVMNLAGPVYGDLMGLISTDGATTFDALQDKSMGTVDGYNWNEEFKSLFGSDLKIYPNPTAMYTDLKSGRLEVAADSFGSATFANEQAGSPWKIEVPEPDDRVAASLEPAQVCFPMAKDNAALVDAVTEDIETLRDSGTLADLLEQNGLDPAAADVGELRLIG